jgi:hypothetical protein
MHFRKAGILSVYTFLWEFNIKLLVQGPVVLSKTDTPTTPGKILKQHSRSQKMQIKQARVLPQTRHASPKHVFESTD